MPIINLKLIKNYININHAIFKSNQRKMKMLDIQLDYLRINSYEGWGNLYKKRIYKKKKFTSWERVKFLSDTVYDILPFGTFINELNVFNTENSLKISSSAGVITIITRIHKLLIVVIANDNTVAAGSWWPNSPRKIIRL